MESQKVKLAGRYYTQNEESLDLSDDQLKTLRYIEYFPNIEKVRISDTKLKEILQATHDFFIKRQEEEKQNEDKPIFLRTTKTKSRMKIEDFVQQKKIKIVP